MAQFSSELFATSGEDQFSLQPFRQFADVLRRSGYEDNAKDVLIDMHRAKREHGGLSVWGRSWSQILQRSIGFGYRSHWAFGWTLLFVLFGAVLFNFGYRSGLIVPAKPPATSSFSAVGYSLDTFLPIVNLHQEELWTATDGGGGSRWLQYYYWLHIALGWALVTLGVAGFTGLIRKE